MTNKKRTIKELKEVLDSLDITNKYRLNLIRAIEYLQDESVSESNEQLTETYLAVFDKKFPILPTLKGKQLADYKNFLNKCQQIFGLKEWGIRPTQAKLFEKLSLLWAAWGVEHLQGVGRQDKKEQDIPVSEDLEKAIDTYLATYFGGEKEKQDWPFLKKMAIHFAKWQKQKDRKWLADNHKQIFNNGWSEGYEVGRDSMEEDMMKDAVNGVVHHFDDILPDSKLNYNYIEL